MGSLAGGGLFVAIMLLLAGIAIASGWIAQDQIDRVDLGPWLALEVAGGAIASVLAGAVSWRIARRYHGPALLAGALFCVGALEATSILGYTADGDVAAPTLLVFLAPVVGAAGVVFGGWCAFAMGSNKTAEPAAAELGG